MGLIIKGAPPKKPAAANMFDDHLTAKPVMGAVHVGNKAGKVLKDESTVEHPGMLIPDKKTCTVGVSATRTVNLGNYESVKIMVSLTTPCLHSDIDDAYKFGTEWVSKKIEEELGNFKGAN